MRRFLVLSLLAALAVPVTSARAVLPQNDAGTGKDAPDKPTASFRVAAGVVHLGHIEGKTGGDRDDWYAVPAAKGATIAARIASPLGCLSIHDPKGAELDLTCWMGFMERGPGARVVAPAAGTYYLRVHYRQPTTDDSPPQPYRFSYALNAAAPAPTPIALNGSEILPVGNGAAPVSPATRSGKHVVVAVVDTGINLYHRFFRAPQLDRHPSTWLRGFPASARTVPLSLGAKSYAAATAADEERLAGMKRSTYDDVNDTYDAHLYTFPGTRVVGGISFGEYTEAAAPPSGSRPVLDDHGHGTHSAGLAGGANLAAADGNVLIVAVEITQGQFANGIRWAARQPWIDAISVSLGKTANAPATFSPIGDRTGEEWATLEAAKAGKPVFMASGNGFSNTGLAADRCSTYTSPMTGPSWVTLVGAANAANGSPTLWHCTPVTAIAKTDVASPSYDDLGAVDLAGGTSAATPNVAGHYAHLLLAARRAGSRVDPLAVRDHLLRAAAPPAPAAGRNSVSVYPLSLPEQGYGLVDQAALDAARTRLLKGQGPLPRAETETWFAQDAALRDALWGPGSATDGGGGIPDTDDDAGSGADAPDKRSAEVRVKPGTRYDATSTGRISDLQDWYAFPGKAGETVSFAVAAAGLCYDLVRPSGGVLASACPEAYQPVTLSKRLPESGTWYLAVRVEIAQTYSFAYALNGTPPPVFP